MRKLIVAAVALLIVIVACVYFAWPRGVKVIVNNKGASPMTGVTVVVTGGTFVMKDIPPGASRSVYVKAAGESSITLNYTDAAGPRSVRVDCYFEGGYRGSITVDVANGTVIKVNDQIRLGVF